MDCFSGSGLASPRPAATMDSDLAMLSSVFEYAVRLGLLGGMGKLEYVSEGGNPVPK